MMITVGLPSLFDVRLAEMQNRVRFDLAANHEESSALDFVSRELRARMNGEGVSTELFDDQVPPTDAAKSACLDQFRVAASRFPTDLRFPIPHLEADGDGGLDCEWNRADRSLSVTFSSEGAGRLHAFVKRDDGAKDRIHLALPDPERLVAMLEWVAGYAELNG